MLEDSTGLFVVSQRTLKKVQGTVVLIEDQVLKIVLQGHSQLIAVVIFPNFEFTVLVTLIE